MEVCFELVPQRTADLWTAGFEKGVGSALASMSTHKRSERIWKDFQLLDVLILCNIAMEPETLYKRFSWMHLQELRLASPRVYLKLSRYRPTFLFRHTHTQDIRKSWHLSSYRWEAIPSPHPWRLSLSLRLLQGLMLDSQIRSMKITKRCVLGRDRRRVERKVFGNS